MAIEKKRYWLRHLILIIVLAIVLFPMVWVVSTSIRRDEAAFSPKLFSTRVTLQHYQNLLFPKKSISRVILSMQQAVHGLGDYRKAEEKKVKNEITDLSRMFDNYIDDSIAMVDSIEMKFEAINESVKRKISEIISGMNDIRHQDIEIIDERLDELQNKKDSDLYQAALLNVISNEEFSVGKGYRAFIEQTDIEPAGEILKTIENYKNQYNAVLDISNELINLLADYEFDGKDDVINSLNKVSEYISQENISYSQWRSEHWLKVINRNLKNIGDVLEQEKAKTITNKKDQLYDTFKSAKATWEKMQELHNNLIEKTEEVMSNALSEFEYSEYIDAQSRLETIENKIAQINSKLENLNEAIPEIKESLNVAGLVLVPETTKMDKARETLKTFLASDKVKQEADRAFPVRVLGNMETLVEELIPLKNKLSNTEESLDVYTHIEEAINILNWFVERKELIVVNQDNPDVENVIGILEVSYSNISRVKGDLTEYVNQYADLTAERKDKNKELSSLLDEKEKLESVVAETKPSYEDALNRLSNNIEIAELNYLKDFAQENIETIDEAENYYNTVSKTMKKYFQIKSNIRYRSYTWYSDFVDADEEINQATSVIRSVIDKMRSMKQDLDGKILNYVELRFLGASVDISVFDEMTKLFNREFQNFNASYKRAQRLIGDMIDFSTAYSGEYIGELREVDRSIFKISQIWTRKESTYFYFMRWLFNSIVIALSVAIISVLVAAFAAYPFSRMRFFGRGQGLLFLLLIQMFPTIMFMIAIYSLLQFLGNYVPFLGLDTISGMIFIYCGNIAFNIWLIKGYFDTIPDSLEESALIDGANRLQTFWKIVLPLARPILAVIAILTFMNVFNEFVMASIILQSIDKWTYAVGLQQFSGRFEASWGPFTAAALIGAIPMLTFFLLLQDQIVGGLTKGSVKG
ncbi:MAG: ABC transporter permease subunit [Thermotogota bacterium]|nr:ABC transporter permease subunit [Thermotogota bacterium]